MKIRVCIGSACHLKGSYNVINSLQQLAEEYKIANEVEVEASFCLRLCSITGVSVQIEDKEVQSVSDAGVREFFEKNILPEIGK